MPKAPQKQRGVGTAAKARGGDGNGAHQEAYDRRNDHREESLRTRRSPSVQVNEARTPWGGAEGARWRTWRPSGVGLGVAASPTKSLRGGRCLRRPRERSTEGGREVSSCPSHRFSRASRARFLSDLSLSLRQLRSLCIVAAKASASILWRLEPSSRTARDGRPARRHRGRSTARCPQAASHPSLRPPAGVYGSVV